jgi:hypothetical protein
MSPNDKLLSSKDKARIDALLYLSVARRAQTDIEIGDDMNRPSCPSTSGFEARTNF